MAATAAVLQASTVELRQRKTDVREAEDYEQQLKEHLQVAEHRQDPNAIPPLF